MLELEVAPMPSKMTARFIEQMLLLRIDALPEDGEHWEYQVFDGYRAISFKSRGRLHLRSRNNNDFSIRYQAIRLPLPAIQPSPGMLRRLGSRSDPTFWKQAFSAGNDERSRAQRHAVGQRTTGFNVLGSRPFSESNPAAKIRMDREAQYG